MRMVERHRALGLGQGFAQFELRIIGQKRAGQNGRRRGALPLDHHARGGAHHRRWILAQDTPAGGRDLGHVYGFVHLRKKHCHPRVLRVDPEVVQVVQGLISGAGLRFCFPPDGAARYGEREWSPNIIRRLEDATGLSVLGGGVPAEMVDDEPEEPGAEVVPRR